MLTSRLTLLFVFLALFFKALQQPLDQNEQNFWTNGHTPSNILLLTAHPDDECMFFAPTITSLGVKAGHVSEGSSADSSGTNGARVYSLCLSAGDADGLGDIRREELGKSLDVLGIEKHRRWLVDHPCVHFPIPQPIYLCIREYERDVAEQLCSLCFRDLKDDITSYWDEDIIAEVLEPYIIQNNITAV